MQFTRVERLRKLEELLLAGAMTLVELVEALKGSHATIRRDLRLMRQMGAPIRFCRKTGWYWHTTEARRRITVEEAETKNRPKGESSERILESPELLLPFGFLNPRWRALIAEMQPGNELWEFCSDDDSWQHLSGYKGIELLRDGRTIGRIVTSMN